MAAASGYLVGKDQAEPGAERNDEMKERIWAWEYAGSQGNEGQWRSSKGACPSQGYVIYEHIRADHVDALLKAERERALREAAEVLRTMWASNNVEHEAAILDLIEKDQADG